MLSIKDVDKRANYMKQFRRYCTHCGHSLTMVKDKVLCYWCGTMNYADKKEEFKAEIKKALKK